MAMLEPGTPQPSPAGEAAGPKKRARSGALRRFARNPLAVMGALITLSLLVVAAFAPQIAPYDALEPDYSSALLPPGEGHLLGTDDLGRDVLSRVIYGARASVKAAAVSVGLALLLGVPIGLFAGYSRGFWDEVVIMRVVDAMQAFPFMLLALAIAATLGPGLTNATIAIGIGFTPAFIRLVRAQVLAQREQEYVQSARALGASEARVMFLHILPNSVAPILVQASLSAATAIITEAGLSYLGLGTQPPDPSWGSMLRNAQTFLGVAPWLAYAPGAAIFLAVLAFNVLGDGLRDALDPRLKGRT